MANVVRAESCGFLCCVYRLSGPILRSSVCRVSLIAPPSTKVDKDAISLSGVNLDNGQNCNGQ